MKYYLEMILDISIFNQVLPSDRLIFIKEGVINFCVLNILPNLIYSLKVMLPKEYVKIKGIEKKIFVVRRNCSYAFKFQCFLLK